jgi:hypothetical protein
MLKARSSFGNGGLQTVELRRLFQPPFRNAPSTGLIQFLAKHPDCFWAVVKFAELRRGQSCSLYEGLDLSVDEHTDFILDGGSWGCRHENLNDILADWVRVASTRLVRMSFPRGKVVLIGTLNLRGWWNFLFLRFPRRAPCLALLIRTV